MREFYVISSGQQHGPIDEETLRQWLAGGRVSADDLAWSEGLPDWQPIRQVFNLADAPTIEQSPLVHPSAVPWQRPHRGAAVLTLGIISLAGMSFCQLSFICGIIAWVMANNDMREMAAGVMDPSGRGMTQAGKICSIISIALVALAGAIFLLVFLLPILMAVVAGVSGAAGP
jgi:hypothetical protein